MDRNSAVRMRTCSSKTAAAVAKASGSLSPHSPQRMSGVSESGKRPTSVSTVEKGRPASMLAAISPQSCAKYLSRAASATRRSDSGSGTRYVSNMDSKRENSATAVHCQNSPKTGMAQISRRQAGRLTDHRTSTIPLASNTTLALGAVNAEGTASAANLTARLDTSLITANGAGSFSVGTADISVPIAVARCTLATCPGNVNSGLADGPYAALDVGIAPVDSDGVSTVLDLDLNADATPDRTQVNSASTDIRYGRIKLSNAFGSELLSLPLTATAQYWDGNDFITNILDDESQFNTQLAPTGNLQAVIAKAPLALGNINAAPAGVIAFTNGVAAFRLLAPNVAGSANLSIMNTHNYLLPSVAGRATFGVYKGANEIIYMRENY